jgi:hypothetical protein
MTEIGRGTILNLVLPAFFRSISLKLLIGYLHTRINSMRCFKYFFLEMAH